MQTQLIPCLTACHSGKLTGPGGVGMASGGAQTNIGMTLRGGPEMGFVAKGNVLGLGSAATHM
jgi:hypothetical protein